MNTFEKIIGEAWHKVFHTENEQTKALEAVFEKYNEPHRKYHNLRHISEMLQSAAIFEHLCKDFKLLQIAIIFHDVEYKAQAIDNEERSEVFARNILNTLAFEEEAILKISKMILQTKNHFPENEQLNFETKILLDCDLKILGETAERYAEYKNAVRQEFCAFTQKDYEKGRKDFLTKVLKQKSIYKTNYFIENHELTARTNIQNELWQYRN